MHWGRRVLNSGIDSLQPGLEPLEIYATIEPLAVAPVAHDDLPARIADGRIHRRGDRVARGGVLHRQIGVDAADLVDVAPPGPQQRGDAVLDNIARPAQGQAVLP